jgi:CRISPR-associated protein Csm3
MDEINLLGKVIITGTLEAKTGIRVGGPTVGLDIGGVDSVVVKDPKGVPYIPGSSLKGKMRSLLEKAEGKELVKVSKKPLIRIHKCKEKICEICKIFGLPGEEEFAEPTRLIVRDSSLIEKSLPEDIRKNLDLEWTEVKWENIIDRITSAANPRQMERVPAGAKFGFEAIYNVLTEKDKDNLKYVFKAMELLEDDYLGGQGSRGYGKVKFEDLKVYWNSKRDYESGNVNTNPETTKKEPINKKDDQLLDTPAAIVKNFKDLKNKIQ